ncbi:hypothetical protein MARTHA_50 [Arthrobacter phage Martha]|uniref:Uncharacterized protein n=1 Tax=Arthrobacter phage Martha TaxID=1772307 RepID=A0A0U4IWH7_9CAUD|nr:hypothetical protein FDH49_gp50 [Arthrobacter phage Martha]ALY09703.1 hypothetical protein MARTHA_50 [Arthrobacter phage Martha]
MRDDDKLKVRTQVIPVLFNAQTAQYEAFCASCDADVFVMTLEYTRRTGRKVPLAWAHECPPAKPYWET